LTPWILNQVASVADAVEDIAFGTANGPMRFGLLFFSVMSDASTIVRVDGPPEPMMMPVRSFSLMSLSSRPESAIACFMATWFHAPPWLRKRMARRSTRSVGSSEGLPHTWHLKPCSAKSGEKEMPDFAPLRDAVTSAASLPMEETMPRPVTTTRLMNVDLFFRLSLGGQNTAGRLSDSNCQVQAVFSFERPTRRSDAW
jgi:hypothetical protein